MAFLRAVREILIGLLGKSLRKSGDPPGGIGRCC